MRKRLVGVALAFAVASPAAADAQITSTNTSICDCLGPWVRDAALMPFDDSLGALTGISLSINANGTSETSVSNPGGPANLLLGGLFKATVNGVQYSVPLSGSYALPGSFGGFAELNASGTQVFQIDPSLFSTFVGTADDCITGIGVCVSQHGYYGAFPTNQPPGSSFSTIEVGTFATYTVTYSYTPWSDLPEPSTWAMMLLGFAAIGLATRRDVGRVKRLLTP